MATWFVRPNAAHSSTRNGTSYANAWGGWSEIQWGVGFVNTGDTLYVCGAHLYTSIITMGVAGVTVLGNYATETGSINFTGTGIYFNVNKDTTTLESLTLTSEYRCIVPSGTPLTGFTLRNCTLNGSNMPCIEFLAINTWAWINTTIEGNTFNGGVGGGAGAAISWWPQTAIETYFETLKIKNNTFNGCSAAQGVIVLLATPTAANDGYVYITNLEVSGNTFTNCGGTAIKAYVPRFGQNMGVKIFKNTIMNQKRVGTLGGGIVVGGFAHSTDPTFGWNVIENNYADGLEGTTGFANIMYGRYITRYNVAKNISSIIYDGCGLLFDHGAYDCVAYGNYFENLSGPADFSAGAGIGVIFEATNITCYGNVIKNAYVGVLYGNQSQFANSNIFNNLFIDCVLAGVRGIESTYPADLNYVRNNIFTAKSSDAIAISYLSGTWNRETNNVFYGFKTGTQALHASDITTNPNLSDDFLPKAPEVKAAGTFLGGEDYYGKPFYNPPTIGAVQDRRSTRRYVFKR